MTISNLSVIRWIGQQLQAGPAGDLPTWNPTRGLWYVAKLDRHFDNFEVAVKDAMAGTVKQYKAISVKTKFLR